MNKGFLNKIESINKEIEDLQKRLDKISNKESTIAKDTVQGSSKEFPYIKHTCIIEGVQVPNNRNLKNKYRKMIKHKKYKSDKLKVQLEYELNYIEDAEIRQIIRYRYNDNKTWLQIMFSMKYSSENTARMKLERYLKKY